MVRTIAMPALDSDREPVDIRLPDQIRTGSDVVEAAVVDEDGFVAGADVATVSRC